MNEGKVKGTLGGKGSSKTWENRMRVGVCLISLWLAITLAGILLQDF